MEQGIRETRRATGSATPPHRMVWLDGLRGIAVFAVLLAHILQHWSVYDAHRGDVIQLGLFGVVVFFFTSGYIIPVSALRHHTFRHFWWARAWRLYPAYWLSVLCALAVLGAGWASWPAAAVGRRAEVVAWNVTMLASFGERPNLVGVYWTLSLELVFYAMVSIGLLLRLLRYPELFAGGLLATCVLLQALLPAGDAVIFTQWTLFVACLWCGSVAQQVHDGTAGPRKGWVIGVLWLGVVLLQLLLPGTRGMVVAELLAAGLCLWALRLRPTILRGVWCWMGRISYSLYLFHLLIVEHLPWATQPIASGLLAVGLSLAVAALLERWVEQPAIRLGRKLQSRWSARSRVRPAVTDQSGAVSADA